MRGARKDMGPEQNHRFAPQSLRDTRCDGLLAASRHLVKRDEYLRHRSVGTARHYLHRVAGRLARLAPTACSAGVPSEPVYRETQSNVALVVSWDTAELIAAGVSSRSLTLTN